MHKLYELKDMLCEELEEYGSKDKLDVGGLDIVDKLAHAIKNIDKVIEAYKEEMGGYSEEDGYSGRYPYYYSMNDSYDGNGSMNGNMSNRGGSYARGGRRGGRSYARNGRGGYSRAESDMNSMISELKGMMGDLPEDKQTEVRKFIEKIERM